VEQEQNYYFKQLAEGLSAELLAPLGEALLALQAQRCSLDPPAGPNPAQLLRAANLNLARALLKERRAKLNAVQQLFMHCGALADVVHLQSPSGEPLRLELLDTALYERLLAEFQRAAAALRAPDSEGLETGARPEAAAPAEPLARLRCLWLPSMRWRALADGLLEPYDPETAARNAAAPGRRGPRRDGAALRHQFDRLLDELREAQAKAAAASRDVLACLRNERLAPALQEAADWIRLTASLLECGAASREKLATLPALVLALEDGQGGEVEKFERDLQERIGALKRHLKKLRSGAAEARELAAELTGAQPSRNYTCLEPRSYSDAELRRLVHDHEALHKLVSASLLSAHRSSTLGASLLLSEQLAKLEQPLEHLALPESVAASILRVDALHPDCFPHDVDGWPQLPPLLVVPGVDIAAWLDDRFVLGFVVTDQPRHGPQLSLSPLDQAVLRLYAQYVARGGVFNYRGERLKDSFMAEYSADLEERAVAKFSGQEMKLTYATQSTERDSASREDAVRDYCDFMFCVHNGLPLPKRISTRKAAVLIKYCTIGSAEQTVLLALRLLPKEEFAQIKESMLRLAGRDRARLVKLFAFALGHDVHVRSRFKGDLRLALFEVMGHEIGSECAALGLLEPGAPSASESPLEAQPLQAGSKAVTTYFKL
jgi:hypothetical protein